MTILRVQGNANGHGLTTPVSVTMSSPPQNGNFLVATIGIASAVTMRTVSSVTQTNVLWTKQNSKILDVSERVDVEIWAGIVSANASNSISVAYTGNPDLGGVINVCEYSGIATSSFLDKVASGSGAGPTLLSGTTSVTSKADELWIGTIVQGTTILSTAQSNPTNGFTLLDGTITDGKMSNGYCEKIVSTTGTASVGTTGQSFLNYVGCIATFLPPIYIPLDINGLGTIKF